MFQNYRQLRKRRANFLARRAPVATVEARASVQEGRYVIAVGDTSFFVRPVGAEVAGPEVWDFALFGLAAISMSRNIVIRFGQPVSEDAALALDTLRRTFEFWNLNGLAPLRLELGAVVTTPQAPKASGGVICLSGGIDSTAAAIEAVRDHGVDHGMLIAGADYPEADHPGFRELRTRVEKLSERLGLELLVTETSIRNAGFKWQRLFSLCLGMCLHAQSGRFRVGALGADYSRAQDPVMFPWGGSHALCAALGTDSFPILPLGTGLARTGKLASIIAFDPGLAKHLSVCWQDKSNGGNCGSCPKCQRTKLNFLAATGEIPDIFRDTGSVADFIRSQEVPDRFGRLRVEMIMMADIHQNLPDSEIRALVGVYLDRLRMAHAMAMPES